MAASNQDRATSAGANDARVRMAVYASFSTGRVPRRADVAAETSIAIDEVALSYERLAAAHVLVLQPDTREVWMAMPFSAVPTAFRVEGNRTGWWAPCAWDALGIPVALGIDAHIKTECARSEKAIHLFVERGNLHEVNCVAHFAVPASRWWDDIGFT